MQHDFILLDRSGSMGALWSEALGSVNAYVKKLAEDKVDTGVTLAAFDYHQGLCFDIIRDRIIPSTWHDVTTLDATPRGMTPLNDAIGKIVARARDGNYHRVAIVIMTDGEENYSRELSTEQAKKLLDQCRSNGWQVVFLGADFDNAAQAASYNNAAGSTVQVSAVNLRASASVLASKRGLYGATGQSINFTDAEKAQLKQP